MHGVKDTRLCFGQVNTLLRDNAQARIFELGIDLASQIPLGGIGFDDGQRAFGCHGSRSLKCAAGPSPA